MRARDFLTKDACSALTAAIVAAERRTSGEIRVHIDNRCSSDPREKALKTFHVLDMASTTARNGVLIYVACSSRKVAVLGDKGINNLVPSGFWKDVCDVMTASFAQGRNAEGLTKAVEMVGDKLLEFFPYSADDVNELSDEISFGDDADD